jgi:hypothetical protein
MSTACFGPLTFQRIKGRVRLVAATKDLKTWLACSSKKRNASSRCNVR